MIVIDASVFVAAIVEDEKDFYSKHIYDMIVNNEYKAVVPPIFYYEISNVFLQICRRNRISKEKCDSYLQILFKFPLIVDKVQSAENVAYMAKIYSLTTYDASYLEVAKRNDFELVTLDKQLLNAARKAGVKLIFSDH